jgi:DNA-binding transcriptional MerR regulator
MRIESKSQLDTLEEMKSFTLKEMESLTVEYVKRMYQKITTLQKAKTDGEKEFKQRLQNIERKLDE